MTRKKLSRHLVFLFLLTFVFLTPLENALAQCDGVYFQTTKTQILDEPFRAVSVEDLDGDNKKDILGIQTGANYIPTAFVFYKRNANGFETTPIISNINIQATMSSIAIVDVNGDGHKDFVARFNTAPQTIVTFINDGNGSFSQSPLTIAIDATETIHDAADINDDGRGDLITRTMPDEKLYYRLGQADSTFTSPIQLMQGGRQTLLADLNNDNKPDIVTDVGKSLRIMYNLGSGVFSNLDSDTYSYSKFPTAVADLNNDGKLDLVTGEYARLNNNDDVVFTIYLNNAKNTFTKIDIPVANNQFVNSPVIAADFDGDGNIDLGLGGTRNRIHLNDGNLNFTIQEATNSKYSYHTEDFNNDQKIDFIQLRTSIFTKDPFTGSPLINIVAFEQNVCDQKGQTKAVDFDGDGVTDLGFWKASTGDWRWLKLTYTYMPYPYTEIFYNWGLGTFDDTPVPNDYDGDGKTDYAIYRKSTGQWWVKKSSDDQTIVLKFGIAEDIPIPADFDGDGKADFAVYRPSLGNWYVWYSGTNSSFAIHFGISEDIPLPSDYDGDGKADFAVYRPSTGVWYYLKSASGYQDFSAIQFGISTDIPVPADYDNDGKTDLTVYRDGVWYFYTSGDNSVKVIYYGTAGDIPFPINFQNGVQLDKAGLVIFRPSENRFYSYEDEYLYYPLGSTAGEKVISSIIPIQ